MSIRVAITKPAKAKTANKFKFPVIPEDVLKQERIAWNECCKNFKLADYDYGTPFIWSKKCYEAVGLILSDSRPYHPLLGRSLTTGEVEYFPYNMLHWLQRRSIGVREQIKFHIFSGYLPFYEEQKKREVAQYKEEIIKQWKKMNDI